MHTDRCPDSIHKKIQTEILTPSYLKIYPKSEQILCVLRLKGVPQNDRPGRPAGSPGLLLIPTPYCLCFTSVTLWLISVALQPTFGNFFIIDY